MPTIHFTRGRTFDTATGAVTVAGRTTRLEPQPAALLALLATRPDTLVTHAEIRDRLWGDGRHVAYGAGVHYAVRQIRQALADDQAGPTEVESLPRRGYRVAASALAPVVAAPAAGRSSPPGLSRRRRLHWAVAAMLAVATVAWLERQPNDHHQRVVAFARVVHDAIY